MIGVGLFGSPPALGSPEEKGGCPNEGLRAQLDSTFLPDCRADEMVTPPYKEGYILNVKSFAPNGEAVILESQADLAGTSGSGDANPEEIYLAKRTEGGWQLSALNAPMSAFVGQVPLAVNADTNHTLWEQHTPQEGISSRGLYVRQPTGQFDFIGRLTPDSGVEEEPSNIIAGNLTNIVVPVAATDDFGHVVLEAVDPSARWPSDETGVDGFHHSLYEYSGTDNKEPVIVGAEGEKGSSHLIAPCGTTLGSGANGSRYNALSSGGETIFFTVNPCSPGPSKAEIYARLDGSMTSAGAAATVQVSGSECTLACGSEESGKNFEGASDDGKLVYFTSTQKLTDEAVDGTASGDAFSERGCPGSKESLGGCNLYLYDVAAHAGARLKAVSVGGEVLGVAGIAEDGSRVYYVSRQEIDTAGENAYGKVPVKGQPNLYIYDAKSEKTSFIATLEVGDKNDWRRVFERSAEVAGESGRSLLFASAAAGLTPDDTREGLTQLFDYRAAAEGEPVSSESAELIKVTKGEDGFNEDGNGVSIGASLGPIESANAALGVRDFKSTVNRLTLSADGGTAFFLTAGQLSPRATSSDQKCRNLYEFHSGGRLSEGSVHLVSDGGDTQLFKGVICGPQLQGLDASGANVLFTASDPLLPSDVDGGQRDVYDAREDGGFPLPQGAGICGAGTCGGSPTGLSPLPAIGSAGTGGEAPVVSAIGKAQGKARAHQGRGKLTRASRACRGRPRPRGRVCRRIARRRLGLRNDIRHTRRGM
jgi:hypothetical protein